MTKKQKINIVSVIVGLLVMLSSWISIFVFSYVVYLVETMQDPTFIVRIIGFLCAMYYIALQIVGYLYGEYFYDYEYLNPHIILWIGFPISLLFLLAIHCFVDLVVKIFESKWLERLEKKYINFINRNDTI